MPKPFAILVLALGALSTAATATPIEKRGRFPGDIATLPCMIRVDFTSLATGPDLETFNAMRAYLADSKDTYLIEAWNWGREGEFSLCLRVDGAAAIARVVEDLTRLVPERPVGAGGPTFVRIGPL